MQIEKYIYLIIVLLITHIQVSHTQESDNYSILVDKMKSYAWENKDYDKAIKINKKLLELYPGNTYLEHFIGNLYFYSGQDSLAIEYLELALSKEPDNMDIVNSLYHLNYKNKKFNITENYIDKLIAHDSTNVDYKLRKVQVLEAAGKHSDALLLIEKLIHNYPDNQEVKYLSDQIKNYQTIPDRTLKNGIGFMYRQLSYSQDIEPKFLISGKYIRKAGNTTIVTTGTYGKHFDFKGILLESDLYINHNKNDYSHVILNWSNKKELFPELNVGYTFFHNLGKGWVPGLGLRYTHSNSSNVYTLLTDISKYWNRNLSQIRIYGLIDDRKLYQAYSLSHRYYISSLNYLQLMYTLGTSPDDKTRLVNANMNFMAHNISLYGNLNLSKHFDTRAYFNYTNQKININLNYSIYEFGFELIYSF